jgi:hypothetical protein
MHYLSVVGYETGELDRNGNARIQKTSYVVEALSVEEVTIILAKYRGEDSRSSQLVSIKKLDVECIIDTSNTPQYYKTN